MINGFESVTDVLGLSIGPTRLLHHTTSLHYIVCVLVRLLTQNGRPDNVPTFIGQTVHISMHKSKASRPNPE